MQTRPPVPPKPLSHVWHPELTRLPPLHWRRRLFRLLVRLLARFILRLLTRLELRGLEQVPSRGPALIVMNHLGDADTPLVLSALSRPPEALGKLELIYEFPVLGRIMDWYGTIWIHRGRIDRRALDCALQALVEHRILIIAPEGRYSLTHGLERGGSGAAFVSLHSGLPLIPLVVTGTRNSDVYSSLRHFRRPRLTLTVGPPIHLDPSTDAGPRALKSATDHIMRVLAAMLPPDYRGLYADS